MDKQTFFEQDPAKLEGMIKLNLHPYALLAKYGAMHASQHAGDGQSLLVLSSGQVGEVRLGTWAVFGATQAFNAAF